MGTAGPPLSKVMGGSLYACRRIRANSSSFSVCLGDSSPFLSKVDGFVPHTPISTEILPATTTEAELAILVQRLHGLEILRVHNLFGLFDGRGAHC
jgi:hypothetical protein